MTPVPPTPRKKRKSGVPTGNAGEYFVMAELLRRGYDAQLADRNTAGYDILVGRAEDRVLRKVQVKTVRAAPWYVRRAAFTDGLRDEVTVYVLLGAVEAREPVRYFIAKNSAVAHAIHVPPAWPENGLMPLVALRPYEGCWENIIADARGTLAPISDR